jgi:hypothetical protein
MNFSMKGMLEQAQKMQQEMERIRQEVNNEYVTEESGGGMVAVTVSGANIIKSIKISPELVNPDEIEMLEDLVVAAANKALNSAGLMVQEKMKSVSAMLPNIPGLNLNL